MEDCLHTSSENLSRLVRWAHSHGTICALIPNLKHLLTEGSHGNLTAMWGCSAGHAYHWPLPATCKTGQKERGGCYQDSRSVNSDSLSVQGGALARQSSPGGERFLGRSTKAKGGDSSQTRDSCDFSNCSDDNTEADDNTEEYNSNLFDIVCESSATTDEDGDVDYEPHHRPRKRGPPGGMPGPQRPGSEDRGQGDKSVKKIKQETAEDYYTVPKAQLAAGVGTDSGMASHSVSQSPKPNNSLSHHALPHTPFQLDADCLVGGVSSSLLGRSFPHKPLRGSISSSVSKPSMMSVGSPRHQDLSSVSTQGLSTLPGAGSELMEDLLKHGGSEGPLGTLTPSSPSGMNPDLLEAETKGEATDFFWPTSSSHFLTSEPTEERRRVEEFVASIDLGQLQSLQTVIRQVLSFREKKTERGEERRTERVERGQDWRTERVGERRVGERRVEERRVGERRVEERRVEERRVEERRVEERRVEERRVEERRVEERRAERGQFHEDRAPSHYPQPHIYQPNTHQQQTQFQSQLETHQQSHPQFQSHLETHRPQLQPQPEPTRWRGRHREQLQGQQELYPGSGVLLSSLQLAAMFQEARGNCMRLFHLLFEHFFTEEDLIGAVAFGRRGKVPDGKKILDRRTVDAIIAYVLHCSALDGWTSVESAKLKKACINKCRLRMCQRRIRTCPDDFLQVRV
ncbi:uncharacterized protein LOC129818072 isoform X2 [Salvelinus fontinalis]|uniref:uncharacterized protein LOC129818072 isoform X1 n=1 Tax=Salvelinus fontinalis TaxID=8038 RepID=UPI002485C5E8|nr:uncharacterized protein LOC129818072 isoform X1 [Salvelinus fontinalis]XP_055729591.1 uncharacterized protein LOC129818072 isoform X2 [Salvelinus fontinalis]